jgi:hypothetical protein
VGERTAAKFVNDALYKDGAGLFPLPVKAQADLPVDRLDPTPDVEIPQPAHFVTRVFEDPDNAFVGPLRVRRYLAAADGWRPPAGSTVEVIARLRNGAPLAVTKTFGKGRVVVFLTTAGLGWNNWARNPSFPVMMLDLHAFLARRENGGAGRQVGAPLAVRLEGPYKHEVAFSSPQSKGQFDVKVDASVGPDRALWANFLDTDEAGIYTAQLTRTDDTVERRNFAVNVDPAEGDLEIAAKTDLAARLAGIDYVYQYAQDLQFSASELAGYNLSQALMYFLILLLLGEQVMAWSASYHMPARAAKGGAQ